NKIKRAKQAGINSFHHQLKESTTEEELIKLIDELNLDKNVHGILVQLPLPKHMNEHHVIESLDPKKDVDGFHPQNLGYLLRGDPKTIACTPLGIMHLIRSVSYELKGKHAVVLGRSNIVGKPMAQLLLSANATVSICHRYTQDTPQITRHADIVIAAV